MTDPLRFRNPTLVVAVLGYVYDADEPIPWEELVETFTSSAHAWKTVENVIYELVTFGALHRTGKPSTRTRYGARTEDTRALRPTPLGRAWLDRELLDTPGAPDPLDDAEEIAAELEVRTWGEEDPILRIHTLEPGSET